MALLVSCAEKANGSDPYLEVTAIGGQGRDGSHWHRAISEAIAEVEKGLQTYYVIVNGITPNLVVADRAGKKYLKAPFDPGVPATLLSLPGCS
jgi:hypothetical protein